MEHVSIQISTIRMETKRNFQIKAYQTYREAHIFLGQRFTFLHLFVIASSQVVGASFLLSKFIQLSTFTRMNLSKVFDAIQFENRFDAKSIRLGEDMLSKVYAAKESTSIITAMCIPSMIQSIKWLFE